MIIQAVLVTAVVCVCFCSMVDLAGAEVVDSDSHRTELLCYIFYIVCNATLMM